ncbi:MULTISPECIES: heparinase II/III domain-containing protein [unclassified Psychrobacter]|uniref:heparinase II/III domain-containing protein n=1 Tax=unclassified Psychrobacter TaxID=196806 RepID=UPI00086CABAD|nr:heparinase II/III family protein [Psychrobacter sp. B29-1]OEH67976.1 MAG: hypothetical protein BAX61_03955 [Psychrobacter sp. B29-1]
MLIPYENLMGASNRSHALILKKALQVLDQGWVIGNYPAVKVDRSIDWQLYDEDQRSWNFHIHSWDMVEALLTAYNKDSFKLFLRPTVQIALDWVQHHTIDAKPIVSDKISKFAWYDMAAGLRAYRLAFIIDAADREGLLTKKESCLLWDGLLAHDDYLKSDDNIAFHTNHGYYQAAGQIAMGRRFAQTQENMATALEQGIERFKIMLDTQFTQEGVHREHSPDYHRMVYETLVGVINAELIDDESIIAFTKNIEKALSWFIYPNRRIVNFGDSDSRDVTSTVNIAKLKWQTSPMHFVTTNGEFGSLNDKTLKVFKEAGYFIVRNRNSATDLGYDQYSYLAQNAAFHSRTHKHADDLSFVWYDRGHNILIDAGRYGYIGKAEMGSELWKEGYWYTHPNRLYCESTRAHNTLEFDEKDYTRKGVKPYGSAIGRHKQYPNGLTILETECKHFKTIRRARLLIYMPNQWLITYDWFKDNLDEPHDVRQCFNFAPEIKVEQRENSYTAQLNNKTELHITNLLDKSKASKVLCGVELPRLQGWFSPSEREFIPADSISYDVKNISTGSIATLFSFNSLPIVNLANNVSNASGRRINLNWKDSVGFHSIRIKRDKDSEEVYCEYSVI